MILFSLLYLKKVSFNLFYHPYLYYFWSVKNDQISLNLTPSRVSTHNHQFLFLAVAALVEESLGTTVNMLIPRIILSSLRT